MGASDLQAPLFVTLLNAAIYVVSGVTQPLLMTLAKEAGLADPSCQLYMLFYYLGPALAILTLLRGGGDGDPATSWPTLGRTACIALVDIAAQTMNYTGSTMAGPTIFAIIYSSVTIWCAILSRVLLGRSMSTMQWLGVVCVFGGLAIAGASSVSMGPMVYHGAALVTVGSALHALMYVLSEAVMNRGEEKVSAIKYCAIYGFVACTGYFAWQVLYTRKHFQELIVEPVRAAGTTYGELAFILLAITVASLVHSLTFFHTVKFFPGGATSAGVMKALQAVLVFIATSWAFCGHLGGGEMCFTKGKLLSLVIVVTGVLIFGKATEKAKKEECTRSGYRRIQSAEKMASFGDAAGNKLVELA